MSENHVPSLRLLLLPPGRVGMFLHCRKCDNKGERKWAAASGCLTVDPDTNSIKLREWKEQVDERPWIDGFKVSTWTLLVYCKSTLVQ